MEKTKINNIIEKSIINKMENSEEKTDYEINRRDVLKYLGKILGVAAVPAAHFVLIGCASSQKTNNKSLIYTGKDGGGIYRGSYGKNPYNAINTETTIKQQYIQYGFMEYPQELDELCKKFSKDGKILENILTRGGWLLAGLNDIVEAPLAAVAGFVGQVFGEEKGKQNCINFVKYFADGTIGGKTYFEMHNKLFRLDGKGAIKVAYDTETTKLGGLGKLVIAGSSDALLIILPLIKHGNGRAAGAGAVGPGGTPPDPF